MILKIDHVGVATPRLAQGVLIFEGVLGLALRDVGEVASQKVRTAFYPCHGVDFELLEPTGPDGPVARFLERRGPGFHHLAFEVDDLVQELSRVRALGVQLIDEAPRPGAHGTRIAFLHPKSTDGLLIEFVQRPKPA